MPHVRMTRSIQFRGRPLDEGVTYPMGDEEYKELATHGSHVDVAPPTPAEPAATAAEESSRETAALDLDAEQAQEKPARSRRTKA